MYPHTHFLFAYLISLIFVRLGYFSHSQAVFIAILAVLIDLDHYISYVMTKKNFSLRKAYNGCAKGHKKYGKTRFHFMTGIVLVSIVVALLYVYNLKIYSGIIAIAYYSHILLDHIHLNYIIHLDKRFKYNIFGFHTMMSYPEVVFDYINIIAILLLLFL